MIYNVYMKDTSRIPQPRCSYCGRFFRPDTRTKKRQKSCSSIRCQSKRKHDAQSKWAGENPDYFTGRYSNTKQWRQSNTDYQRRWRSKRREKQRFSPMNASIKTLRILVPERWLRGQVHEEIRLVKQCECGFFVAGNASKPDPDVII